ncbi:nickel-dependent hydrogenase large subunit [Xanthobacter sediminis]
MTGTTLRHLAIVCDPAHGSQPWRFVRAAGPDPARTLEGRPVDEAARLVPRIFNLCGAAHGFAAARALGLNSAADAGAMARESVRDHALAILHGWPSLLDGTPDRAALRALAQAGPEAALALAVALVGGRLAGRDFGGLTRAELSVWLCAGETATARILSRLRREIDPAEGRAGLPELTAVDLVHALADGPERTGGAPQNALPLRETGALGRVAGTPLFATLIADEGPSLFVRLLARLADLIALLAVPTLARPDAPAGMGLADAARGLLGHQARVENGHVSRYRILSPSAWNLAPGGLLERAVAALDPASPQAPVLAHFVVSAVNPCVPVTLDFQGARHHA